MKIIESIKRFLESSKRVFIVASKPEPKEYRLMLKVIAIGSLIVGFIGFIIYLIFTITAL